MQTPVRHPSQSQTVLKGGPMRIIIHYLFAILILTIYGGQV
jgi:hypothetical protein